MIIVGGGSAGFVLLLFLVMLVVVPILLFRRAGRTAAGSGWTVQQWPPQAPRWEPPEQPVLPAVVPAEVSSLRDRLGHDVSTLEPGADPVARQALADAAERYSTASTLLERATSEAQLRTAWLAAVEGLTATRVVRERLGLDLGPPVPTLPASGALLREQARLDVGGRPISGSPTYAPGHSHWFPGGYYGGRPVPGGWYDVAFWPSALLLGGLGGWALGGLAAGTMYGDDLGVDAGGWDGGFDGGGGGWGAGGGWDGGGSDGGGGGGGGDWGGGGGDGGGGGGGW